MRKKISLAAELIDLLQKRKYKELTVKVIWARTHNQLEELKLFHAAAVKDAFLPRVPSGPGILSLSDTEKDMTYFLQERMKDKY